MDVQSRLAERIDRAAAPLAVGDVVALAIFLTVGMLEHNPGSYLAENPGYWVAVAAPFLIGWIVSAPIVGAYAPGAAESAKGAIPLAIRSWIPAAVIGLALRASPAFPGGFDVAFALVMIVGGAVAVSVWRWLWFAVR